MAKHTHREEVQLPNEQHYREYSHDHDIDGDPAHFHEYAWTGKSNNMTSYLLMKNGKCRITSKVTREY